MSATLFGVVIRETSGKPGWYDVGCSQFAGEVSGVSIKGTTLTAGQRVAVIQSGGWSDQRKTFGFAEANSGLLSVVETTITKNWLLDTNPVNGALHYIFSKAGKAQEIYRPAIVTAVGATTLTVKDWYTDGPAGIWPVVSGLSASDFQVGDGVLLRLIPDATRRVDGWWETTPGSAFEPFTAYGIKMAGGVPYFGYGPIGYKWPEHQQVSGIWTSTPPASLVAETAFDGPDWKLTFAVEVRGHSSSGSVPTPTVYSVSELPPDKFSLVSTHAPGSSVVITDEITLLMPIGSVGVEYYDLGGDAVQFGGKP